MLRESAEPPHELALPDIPGHDHPQWLAGVLDHPHRNLDRNDMTIARKQGSFGGVALANVPTSPGPLARRIRILCPDESRSRSQQLLAGIAEDLAGGLIDIQQLRPAVAHIHEITELLDGESAQWVRLG